MTWDETIQDLKSHVNHMLIERSTLESKTISPSPIWSEAVRAYKYIMNLSSEDFKDIRFHTYLINGYSPWRYWYPQKDLSVEVNAEEEANGIGYSTGKLPEKYILDEPRTFGAGFNYKGHYINIDIARYQHCILCLWLGEFFDYLEKLQGRQLIIEVGSGYGGLAHGMSKLLGNKITYVMIDLPEILMFAGAFLKLHNPEKSLYIYDENFNVNEMYKYDFVFVPNYALDKLRSLRYFAGMINMWSFQEMTGDQVKEYLDFAKERLTGALYSDNQDRHVYNRSNLVSVTDLLRERFDLRPSPEFYDEMFTKTNRGIYDQTRQYLAFQKERHELDR